VLNPNKQPIDPPIERRKGLSAHALIRRQALGGVLVALAVNILIGYAGWRTIAVAGKQSDWVAHTLTVLVRLETTLGHVVDAETGARGFALTGKDSFLDPYVLAMHARDLDMAVLRQLTVDIPAERRSLDVLEGQLRSAYGFSEHMVAARRTRAILSSDTLDENKRRVDAVRTTIQEMRAEAEHALEQRSQASRSSQRQTRAITMAGTLLGVFFLTWAGFTINRELRRNAALEKRVEQRTAALQAENANRAQIQEQLRVSEEMYRLMLDSIKDYAVYMLNPKGEVASWNGGAARIKGYEADEILGHHFACFYTETDRAENLPEKALQEALLNGHYDHRGWRLRRDGSQFWGNTVIMPMYDDNGALRGYSKVVCDITERKQAEDRLLESQNQLAAVIQSAMDGVIAVDEGRRVVLFNATAERIFGIQAAEAIGKPLDRFLPERFRSAHSGHIQGFARTGVTSRAMGVAGPLRGVRSNGEEFPIEASISQVEVGGKKLFTAIVRDVTERERAEAALREQAKVLDLAQVIVRDLDGSIVLWNLGSQELYGFSKEEALGQSTHELLHTEFPEPLERIEEKLKVAGRWEGELVHRKRDGGRIVVFSVWVLLRDAEGHPVRVLETNADITARKQAEDELGHIEKALHVQTRMLHSILDSMGEGLIAADENGKFIVWNPAAVTLLGRGAADLPVDEWSGHYSVYRTDGVTPLPADELPLVRAMRGEAALVELIVRNPRANVDTWMEATARPLKDERGRMAGGVVALRDVTHRKAGERKIRELNDELEQKVIQRTAQLKAANHELETFSYSVSHDLRAPIRQIDGFARILSERLGPQADSETSHYILRIQTAATHMSSLLEGLLDMARMGRQGLQMRLTDLNLLASQVIEDLKGDVPDRQIEWILDPLPIINCDYVLVKAILANLLSNAVKFTGLREGAIIRIGHHFENGETVISVEDNGVGFNMKYADKLFGIFQRLHRSEDFPGTGVGLATVEQIVKKHGGRIWAEAELNAGAKFHFTLMPEIIRRAEGPKHETEVRLDN
jgi:PAS domain S-box-containing protein